MLKQREPRPWPGQPLRQRPPRRQRWPPRQGPRPLIHVPVERLAEAPRPRLLGGRRAARARPPGHARRRLPHRPLHRRALQVPVEQAADAVH